MIAAYSIQHPSNDARLWLVAVACSLLLNVVVVLVLAFMAVHSLIFQVPDNQEAAQAAEERTITIEPVTSEELEAAQPESKRKGFARTSDDQISEAPEDPSFIGERDTQLTSEEEPNKEAEPLPSQDGVEPVVGELETTESDYQDGTLEHDRLGNPEAQPSPAAASPSEEEAAPAEAMMPVEEGESQEDEVEAARTRLAEGPLPVDRPASTELIEEEPKEAKEAVREVAELPEEKPKEKPEEEKVEDMVKPAEAKPANEPGFRGYQRRTMLRGSISRRGRSSLDVQEGALGKYHAQIGRAIERAWQRRCTQHRDLIIPGVIRIQVVLDERGRVRSVHTVEEFGIGAVQKGFTHKAIREAPIPAMPDAVRRELGGEPLELLYNFIF